MSDSLIPAIRVHQYGGPDQLVLEAVPCPVPQAGEVLVRVHAAGVLPADWKRRQGFFQAYMPTEFPYIPGTALAGVVAAVGPGVTGLQPGQTVFGRSLNGTYAEYTTAAADTLALKPAQISFDAAATLSGGATTAWHALFNDGALQAGQRVLIQGAAGGVGLFAVQFARWKGAQVFATTSTDNVAFVRSLGAVTVIDYTTTPFETVVQDVDLVVDGVGGETLQRSIAVVRPGGLLVSLSAPPDAAAAQARGIRAVFGGGVPTRAMLQAIADLVAVGEVRITVGPTFPLAEAAQAHILSQRGHGRGRIVLHIGDEPERET